MNRMEDSVLSPSYFWNCLKLSEGCPFFSSSDPKLYYFAVGLAALYTSLLLMIVLDLRFYWGLDRLYYQVDHFLNIIKKKIRDVQVNQRKLVSEQERTEKQLKKSRRYNHLVMVLRGTLAQNPEELYLVTQNLLDGKDESLDLKWNETDNIADFTNEITN